MRTDRNTTQNASLLRASAVGLIAVLVGGVVHGRMTQRWGPGDELVRAARVVERLPMSFGAWRTNKSEELPSGVVKTLQCEGYVTRDYVNTETSERVQMFVIVGPPGPTAVHTPEICYSSRDYETIGAREEIEIGQGKRKNTFWFTRLKSRSPGGADRHVCYAWTCDETWRASASPRYEYGGGHYLYKIQVSGSPLLSGGKASSGLCERFLADLLKSGWRPKAIDS